MSMDYNRSDKPITEQEGVMFAATPVWDRGKKKKGFGARKAAAAAPTAASPSAVAPEPRSFAAERDYEEPMALDRPVLTGTPVQPDPAGTEYAAMGATMAARPTAAPEGDAALVAPLRRTEARRTVKRSGTSRAPAAIAAGVVALGAVGAVGWYASRDNDGIPELAPGQPTTSNVAAAPLSPVDAPPVTPAAAQTAAATPTPDRAAPAPVRTERRMAQAPARTRPAAAAPSAGESGMNASTTTALPDGPQPYSTLNPGAAPPAIIPAPAPAAPATTEAAPAPMIEAPAAVPVTPPTLPNEPTTETPATDATPPTS